MEDSIVYSIELLLLQGKPETLVVDGLAAKGHKRPDLIKAIRRIKARWLQDASTKDPRYAYQFRLLQHLYDRSYALNDFKICASIVRQMQDLKDKEERWQ